LRRLFRNGRGDRRHGLEELGERVFGLPGLERAVDRGEGRPLPVGEEREDEALAEDVLVLVLAPEFLRDPDLEVLLRGLDQLGVGLPIHDGGRCGEPEALLELLYVVGGPRRARLLSQGPLPEDERDAGLLLELLERRYVRLEAVVVDAGREDEQRRLAVPERLAVERLQVRPPPLGGAGAPAPHAP